MDQGNAEDLNAPNSSNGYKAQFSSAIAASSNASPIGSPVRNISQTLRCSHRQMQAMKSRNFHLPIEWQKNFDRAKIENNIVREENEIDRQSSRQQWLCYKSEEEFLDGIISGDDRDDGEQQVEHGQENTEAMQLSPVLLNGNVEEIPSSDTNPRMSLIPDDDREEEWAIGEVLDDDREEERAIGEVLDDVIDQVELAENPIELNEASKTNNVRMASDGFALISKISAVDPDPPIHLPVWHIRGRKPKWRKELEQKAGIAPWQPSPMNRIRNSNRRIIKTFSTEQTITTPKSTMTTTGTNLFDDLKLLAVGSSQLSNPTTSKQNRLINEKCRMAALSRWNRVKQNKKMMNNNKSSKTKISNRTRYNWDNTSSSTHLSTPVVTDDLSLLPLSTASPSTCSFPGTSPSNVPVQRMKKRSSIGGRRDESVLAAERKDPSTVKTNRRKSNAPFVYSPDTGSKERRVVQPLAWIMDDDENISDNESDPSMKPLLLKKKENEMKKEIPLPPVSPTILADINEFKAMTAEFRSQRFHLRPAHAEICVRIYDACKSEGYNQLQRARVIRYLADWAHMKRISLMHRIKTTKKNASEPVKTLAV